MKRLSRGKRAYLLAVTEQQLFLGHLEGRRMRNVVETHNPRCFCCGDFRALCDCGARPFETMMAISWKGLPS